MNFDEYQDQSQEFAAYPRGLTYPTLGLCGEAGEVAEKIKKLMRDHPHGLRGALTDDVRLALVWELGDVLWYLSALATELGVSLDVVATANLVKLQSRKDRNVLGGSGDDR